MSTPASTRFGRYEIRSRLGAGGMGEVYLAQDTELERIVAIKILPTNIARDHQRMSRFMQEAKAASALNHPNIITIYEIGQADDTRFIATEFIDGETLRRHMMRTRMTMRGALDVASQVAAALVAAHAAGIVHRDIKPENIMVRGDGYVKVLDFGLAKLMENSTRQPALNSNYSNAITIEKVAAAMPEVCTDPGTIIGTILYMSPEQTRGLAVDARTDIWSLGVVLYEMAAGQTPFKEETSGDMIASILNREPPPLARYLKEAPEAFEWIVTKALRKDREERYQTAKELLSDLRSLKHRLDFEVELERSAPSGSGGEAANTKSAGPVALDTPNERAAQTDSMEVARHISSAGSPPSRIKYHKRAMSFILATLVIAGIAFGLYQFIAQNRHTTRPAAPFQTIKLTKLTDAGRARDAVISRDGKYVAHVVVEGGRQSLWVRQVATSSTLQVVPPAEVRYVGLTFSHDDNYIYYVQKEKNNSIGVLYQIAVLGGAPSKLITDIDSPVSLSPDGGQFAFARGSSTGESALMLANADGTGERKLASRKIPDFFSMEGPAWSPDGERIACGAGTRSGVHLMTVIEVGVKDGAEKPIGEQIWRDVGRVAWLGDGSGLVIAAVNERAKSPVQLWYVSYPEGLPRRISNDLNDYNGVSLTEGAATLATVQYERLSSIWVAAGREAVSIKQITSNKHDGYDGLAWTPDGKIIYAANVGGNNGLWIVAADGSGQKQLVGNAGRDSWPSVSPDGRYIVFASDRAGARNIWRTNIDGSDLKQLTGGSNEGLPCISPDGAWVIYTSTVSGKQTLWKVAIDGGEPAQLTDRVSLWPSISPDAKLIACYYREEAKSPWKIAVVPFNGGQPVKIFDIPPTVLFPTSIRWTPDGRALAYIDSRNGVSNIWSQPLDGSKPVQLTDFKDDRIFAFEWSRDGRQLACARGALNSDVVLIADSR